LSLPTTTLSSIRRRYQLKAHRLRMCADDAALASVAAPNDRGLFVRANKLIAAAHYYVSAGLSIQRLMNEPPMR
jgi:hypothetical protein